MANGPQPLYGLRYHTHVTKPGQVKTYDDQVGYWLWAPATGTVIHTTRRQPAEGSRPTPAGAGARPGSQTSQLAR